MINNMRLLAFFFSFCLVFTNLSAQQMMVDEQTPICNIDDEADFKERWTERPSAETQKVVAEICKTMGVNPSTFTLEAATIKKAEALIFAGKRTIHYAPEYFFKIKKETQSDWATKYVLAHEIGHHFNGHTLTGTDKSKRTTEELDADKFAGCALRRMGAVEEDIQKAITFLKEQGSTTHPPRSARLLSTIRGWEDCNEPPKGQKECDKKKTGNITFTNKTRTLIQIQWTKRTDNYLEMAAPTAQLSPNESSTFYNVGSGATRFYIKKADNSFGIMEAYKTLEYSVKQCNENPAPIEIR